MHPSKYLSQRARERGGELAGASALATDVAVDYLFPAGVAFVPPRV